MLIKKHTLWTFEQYPKSNFKNASQQANQKRFTVLRRIVAEVILRLYRKTIP